MVKLKQKEAKYVGYTKSPYDALIDEFEPGMIADEAYRILNDLKDFLTPFLKQIKASKIKINEKKILGDFPIDRQVAFNEMVVGAIGFDFDAGRLDKTTHPFAMGLHPR